MFKRVAAVPIAALLLWGAQDKKTVSASIALPLIETAEPSEFCQMPPTLEERAAYQESIAAYRQRAAPGPAKEARQGSPPGWPGKGTIGGNIPPTAAVLDPWPTFDGMAVDGENGIVAMSDENRHGLLIYDRTSGGNSPKVTEPRGRVIGPSTKLGFVAGVTMNPKRREILLTNNDGGGVEVFSYDANGDAKPIRSLTVPHQSWGLSLDVERDELAVDQPAIPGHLDLRRDRLRRGPRPKRTIRGMATKLEDPARRVPRRRERRGVGRQPRQLDGDAVVCRRRAGLPRQVHSGAVRAVVDPRATRRQPTGDVPPLRTLQGKRTQLAWPMGITIDKPKNELLVANYGSNSILFFPTSASGDTAPSRVIWRARARRSSGRSPWASIRRTTRSGSPITAITRPWFSTGMRRATSRRSESSATRRKGRRRPGSPTRRRPPTIRSGRNCWCLIE